VLVDDEAQHCWALQRVLADEAITVTREQYYARIWASTIAPDLPKRSGARSGR